MNRVWRVLLRFFDVLFVWRNCGMYVCVFIVLNCVVLVVLGVG